MALGISPPLKAAGDVETSAAEKEEYFAEESPNKPASIETPFFSRPLRRLKYPLDTSFPSDTADPMDHPLYRGMLPPTYLEDADRKTVESLLLTQTALENSLTMQYIRQYSGPGGLSWLSNVMERADPYIAFIRKEIAERKLPAELIYLPVIESGYLPTAVSKSGAAGLWQFMKNSISPFDMRVNDWIDERRDFWKSTQGALRKLEENYQFFGDWPLALAAYNAGLGAINQIIRQSGIRDYWTLSEKKLLKTETIHYIPKLLAVSYILSNPRRFGMESRWPEDPNWKQVALKRSVDLGLLADEAGIERKDLIMANRELLYNVTPPGQDYFIKIPAKYVENISKVLEKDIPLLNFYFHTIRSGDTLLALALHYGVRVEQILSSNPGVQERSLKIGSRLLIPALKETGPYERQSPSRENLIFDGSHLVKKGETLWSIALGYNVDPEILAEANGMELTDILREGKILKTPIK